MISSGDTAKATTTANATVLLANPNSEPCTEINVVNEGAYSGFISPDGGKTWMYMPAGDPSATPPKIAARTIRFSVPQVIDLRMKRVGSNNLSGMYADAY